MTAMDVEMEAIRNNDRRELTKLYKKEKTIGVKWVYKTKFNKNREVDKQKAWLVVKGYTQQYGIAYIEVFVPMAHMETIWPVVALATQRGWSIYQLNEKYTFLHGKLNEEGFLEQPCGYVQKRSEQKAYKLKNALYELKQAPRTWYSCIKAYFMKKVL